ncbi:helix-turn-helix transcriptional regulator [Halorussus caseinilyticus]|uniref:Helix-turn-helix transcriptional regulator n=1 Tax=Halorussus caseinilyticus TaxID=3034025 RepID=A0ABD5WIZ4_9EURY|nr:hypothetical protein [Halorussus sp. DT72]
MGTRQFVALLAAVCCLVAAVGTATGVAASVADESATDADGATTDLDERATAAPSKARVQQVTPDTVVLDVRVHENGTAAWQVVYRTRLDDPETSAAFREYKADIENNSTKYSRQFVGRMNRTLRSAEQSTGREMSGTNYSVRAEIREFPQRYGVVVYSFRWRGFAAVSDGRLRVGDSLSGLILNEKTRLLVKWPEGYEAATIQPQSETGYEKREQAVVWNGPIEFAGNEPRIVLAAPGVGGPNVPWVPVAAALGTLAALAVLVGGGVWLYRNRDGGEAKPPEEPPEGLLSNEERVLKLLERRGGRVKQKAVVDELGWTEAKTSQVVGSLRDQGKIESFRLGRENVLALPRERQES